MKSYVLLFIIQLFLAASIVGCLDTSESRLRNSGNNPQVADQSQSPAQSQNQTPASTTPPASSSSSSCTKLALFDGDDDDGGGESDDDDGGGESDDDDGGGESDDDDGGGNPPPRDPPPTSNPNQNPSPERCKPTGNDNQDQKPDNAQLSFANDIAPILSRSCVSSSCHSTQRRADGVDTESYNGTRRSFGRSLRSIKNGSMPIRGFQRLSADEIRMLELWQRQGFKP